MAQRFSFYISGDKEKDPDQIEFVKTTVNAIDSRGWEKCDCGFTVYAANLFDPMPDISYFLAELKEYLRKIGSNMVLTAEFLYRGLTETEYTITKNEAFVSATYEYDMVIPEDAECEFDTQWIPHRTPTKEVVWSA